jgi:mono/diheme cytochrome c family protein
MNKKAFIWFGLVALLLVVAIPLWAFNKDGSNSSSPDKVAQSDEGARELFRTNCGSCHTLARAGTDGVVGPNLDERLAANVTGPPDPAQVEATQTRVLTAIQQGVGDGAMPAGILESTNAVEVANFVARVAGQ